MCIRDRYHVKELTWNDKRYQILSRWNESNVSKNQLYLKAWDCEEEVLVKIRKRTSGSNGKMTICYKNVRMTGVEKDVYKRQDEGRGKERCREFER